MNRNIEYLEKVYKQSSSITFISGRRDSGKTDLSLFLMEKGKEKGFFHKIAANIATHHDSRIEYICYFDRLEEWLKLPGRKAFALDELGKHLYKMAFMSKKARMILEVCQLIRKYDAHLFSCAPSAKLVNSLFLGTDLLDVFIRKTSRKKAEVNIIVNGIGFDFEDIPRTNIKFISKDIARFEMKDPTMAKEKVKAMALGKKILYLYAKLHTCRAVGDALGISAMTVSNYLKKEVADAGFT